VCNLKVVNDDEVPKEKHEKKSGGSGDAKDQAAVDFKVTLKAVILLVLNRLATALEYEKEGFMDLATKLEFKNYMQLAAPQHFEAVLKETWDLDKTPPEKPDLPADDISHAQNKFMKLLEAAEKADWRDPHLSPRELTERIQEAVKTYTEDTS